jgi:hypothetical protein
LNIAHYKEKINGTPKTLIAFDGVVNRDGVSKLSDKLEGDHVAHFKGWIKKLIL